MSDGESLDEADLIAGATSVYRFLRRWSGDPEWAEDMTQETIVKAWQSRGALMHRDRATAWMLTIARRLAIDDSRRRGDRLQLQHDSMDCVCAAVPPPQHDEEIRDEVRRAMTAMDRLPPRQRAVMYLTAVEDLTPREIAEIMDLPAAVVRSNLSVARARMRSMLSNEASPRS
ncbi:MAG: sigma-70 family RNA polymerase sigma factor [Planctomycetota bacterium]